MEIGPYLFSTCSIATVMMEIEEKEKRVIAKPVACRPRPSNLNSFSGLFSGANSSSPPATFSKPAVAVIRPRTVRFKPVNNSDIEAEAALHPSEKAPESNVVCNVVYKPIAKLVSKAAVPLVAKLGDHGVTPTLGSVGNGARIQNHQTDLISDINVPSQSEPYANDLLENSEDGDRILLQANSRDRPSYDGHNWRKYGQKQVKGSKYPRSYYKCTYPNCPMKKKVEKTLDGQIAEIVYKGEHNHSKPQPLSNTSSNGLAQRPAYDVTHDELKNYLINQQNEVVKEHEGRLEHKDVTESSTQSTFSVITPVYYPTAAAECNRGPSTSYNSTSPSGECEEVRELFEAEGDDFNRKKRKCDNQVVKASTVGVASSQPQIVVQKNNDSSITGDGFRWRKYGQKVVKGKMYPRSYYRCTNPGCNVRKFIERTSEDPATFMTTYEGKHNHPTPLKTMNAEVSKTSSGNKS